MVRRPVGITPDRPKKRKINREHQDRDAPAGFVSHDWVALVHTPFPISEAMRIPGATEALNKEWTKLETRQAWLVNTVREKADVIRVQFAFTDSYESSMGTRFGKDVEHRRILQGLHSKQGAPRAFGIPRDGLRNDVPRVTLEPDVCAMTVILSTSS